MNSTSDKTMCRLCCPRAGPRVRRAAGPGPGPGDPSSSILQVIHPIPALYLHINVFTNICIKYICRYL